MTQKKTTKKAVKKSEDTVECNDQFCPFHGKRKLKMRGRTFEGDVIKRLPGRVTIGLERMVRIAKYERYEKRRTKIHARLPECLKDVNVGDRIEVSETRPVSKMIHFVVSKVVKKAMEENEK